MVDLLFYKVVKLISLLQLGKLISIHAPHAGRDMMVGQHDIFLCYFNPRAPCGTRPEQNLISTSYRIFQSTRPMRDATAALSGYWAEEIFQSTRPMRDATISMLMEHFSNQISIHASHAGRDTVYSVRNLVGLLFQSTRPMRDAT